VSGYGQDKSGYITDSNGATIDSFGKGGIYYICEYKRIDTGIVFITSSINELYIFNNRKLIRKYHSQSKIELSR
jgi:hypothetical protein